MPEKIQDFLARHVSHALQGMTFGDWWAFLRRHRFAVDAKQVPRVLFLTAVSASNSVSARIERFRFGKRIANTEVKPPLFVLGHYRSGTTHLHNLLALDPHFAAPNFYQVLNPHTFLNTEQLAAPFVGRLIPRRRFQDGMALGVGLPSEDEIALGAMTGLSPYLAWCFPGEGSHYDQYLTFRETSAEEIARWGQALTTLLKKLTLRFGRPLVLKSPPHTARIKRLLSLFPDARFVHISRHPHAVFRSTRHLIDVVQPLFHLRRGPIQNADDRILSVYRTMYDAYFAERDLIPQGRLCEVAFEALEREPLNVVESIYNSLGLDGFREVMPPRLESYVNSIAGYSKNRHQDLAEPLRRRIADEWGRCFDEWGYER